MKFLGKKAGDVMAVTRTGNHCYKPGELVKLVEVMTPDKALFDSVSTGIRQVLWPCDFEV